MCVTVGNGPRVLGNGPRVLGNGPYVLGNGPHLLGIMSQFGIMSHSALCRIRHYVAFGNMSHSGLCRSPLCRIRVYVIRHNVAFGIMSHLAHYVICHCVIRPIVARCNVVRRNVVWHIVCVLVRLYLSFNIDTERENKQWFK